MNVIFRSFSGLDDELIDMTAEMIRRGKRRRRALRLVRFAVIAAAACIAIPFGVSRLAEFIKNKPEPVMTDEAGGSIALTTAAPVPEAPTKLCEKVFDYFFGVEDMPALKEMEFTAEEYPGSSFKWDYEHIIDASTGEALFSGMPVWSVYLTDLNGDGKREICSTVSSGSGVIDERIMVYDYAARQLYTLADRAAHDYVVLEKNGGLWVREYIYPLDSAADGLYAEYPLTFSALTRDDTIYGQPAQEIPEISEPDEDAGDVEDVEMTGDELREILAEKSGGAYEMYMFAWFGAWSEWDRSPISYELEEDGLSFTSEYFKLPDGWYFHTADEMESRLSLYFTADAVAELMDAVSEGSIVNGKIRREKKSRLISVDGELYLLYAPKAGPVSPDFEAARVESINGGTVAFRADRYISEEEDNGWGDAGMHEFRGYLRMEDGEWKFAAKEVAARIVGTETAPFGE